MNSKDPVLEMYEGLASDYVTLCDCRTRDREQFQRHFAIERALHLAYKARFHRALWFIAVLGFLLTISLVLILLAPAKGTRPGEAASQVSSEVKTWGAGVSMPRPDFSGGSHVR